MSGEPKKLFDLMDAEVEPTDAQLEQLMAFVGEEVRKRKAFGNGKMTNEEIHAAANELVERLINGA